MSRPVVGIDIHSIGQRKTGNETYIRNLVEQFSGMTLPWDMILYHTEPPGDFASERWRAPVHRVRPRQAMVRIPISFPRSLRRDGVALAHFQYVAPPVCPCPTVVTIHDISFERFPEFFNPLERLRMRTLIPLSARRASKVLTISEYSRRDILERYRLAPERVVVTPLAVSDAFRTLLPGEAAAATARFEIGDPFILAVGNLQPRKNLRRLLRAFASLRRSGKCDHDLVLAGQMAWKGHRIEAEVRALGIESFVRFTGYVSERELVGLYNRACVFAYPSTFEGFGLPVLEAMACGVPVLTSDTSALPETAGEAAMTVDPWNEGAIESGLVRLLGDETLRASLRQRGIARAKLFSWRVTAEMTARAYADAMGV